MRDPDFEKQFLDHAARQAGLSGQPAEAFAERVANRLAKGAVEYGGDDAFWDTGFAKVTAEAREEAEDIAGWCLGAVQVLYEDERQGLIPTDTAHLIRVHLMSAVSHALTSWLYMDHVFSMYQDYVGAVQR